MNCFFAGNGSKSIQGKQFKRLDGKYNAVIFNGYHIAVRAGTTDRAPHSNLFDLCEVIVCRSCLLSSIYLNVPAESKI